MKPLKERRKGTVNMSEIKTRRALKRILDYKRRKKELRKRKKHTNGTDMSKQVHVLHANQDVCMTDTANTSQSYENEGQIESPEGKNDTKNPTMSDPVSPQRTSSDTVVTETTPQSCEDNGQTVPHDRSIIVEQSEHVKDTPMDTATTDTDTDTATQANKSNGPMGPPKEENIIEDSNIMDTSNLMDNDTKSTAVSVRQQESQQAASVMGTAVANTVPSDDCNNQLGGLLLRACSSGRLSVVKALLRKGANVNYQNKEGEFPLIKAVANAELVRLLCEHHADVDFRNNVERTALIEASAQGYNETVQVLLEYKAKINVQDSNGGSALIVASELNHDKIVELLLHHNADLNLRDSNGNTALKCAIVIYVRGAILNVKTIRSLLENGSEVNTQNVEGRSPLMDACHARNHEIVKLLLEHKAQVNLQSTNGMSALMLAVLRTSHESTKLLLNHGANIDLQENSGGSVLMMASHTGNVRMVKLLLEHGAQVNLQDNDGHTALSIASTSGHFKIVKILLEYQAEVDLQGKNGWSPLMCATNPGNHFKTVKVLLDHGASVDLQDKFGWSALMYASRDGRNDAVELLLGKGADIDIQSICGMSPLTTACMYKQKETVKLLVDRECSINLLDINRNTPLVFAAEVGCDTETIRYMIEHGALLQSKNIFGNTPLIVASLNGHSNIFKFFLEHGVTAQIDIQNKNGRSALIVALFNNHHEIAKILIEHGAQVNIQDRFGVSALLAATNNITDSSHETIEVLLEHKAQVDMQDNDGRTALMDASKQGKDQIVSLLLEHNAQVDRRDNIGRTALMNASGQGKDEIVSLLLRCNAQVNLQDKFGSTALMYTTIKGYHTTAKILLDCGAQVDLKSHDQMSPLMEARLKGHTELKDLLLEHGAQADLQDDYQELMQLDSETQNSQQELPPTTPQTSSGPVAPNKAQTQQISADIINESTVDQVSQLASTSECQPSVQLPNVSSVAYQQRHVYIPNTAGPMSAYPFGVNTTVFAHQPSTTANLDFVPIPLHGLQYTVLNNAHQTAISTTPVTSQKPSLKQAFEFLLPLASSWQNIGVLLDLDNTRLRKLADHYKNANDCLREMLDEWLKQTNPDPTWEKLANAVQLFDPAIAEKIRQSMQH